MILKNHYKIDFIVIIEDIGLLQCSVHVERKKQQIHLGGNQEDKKQNKIVIVATLTWPSVGVKPNTWKSWGFGVLRNSRMFRARQQDPKHLALGCSWCHWKVLEAQISKMPSHWEFGHLSPKLWAKEGPGVKLAV